MPPPPRRSTRLQVARAAAPTQEDKAIVKKAAKRKAPEYTPSDSESDEEKPDPMAPQAAHLPITPIDPANDPAPTETAPDMIKQPLSQFINSALASSWTVNPFMPMCFIFDAISPTRQFKRGTKDRNSQPFPYYDEDHLSDVTETDGTPTPWVQYMPRKYM